MKAQPPGAGTSSFAEILVAAATEAPEQLCYRFLNPRGAAEDWTHAILLERAAAVALALGEKHAAGTRVLILHQPGLSYVAVVFGCFLAGCVAVPAYPVRPNRSLDRLERIVETALIQAVLIGRAIRERSREQIADSPILAGLDWIVSDELPASAVARTVFFRPLPDGFPALIQFSSGSTGHPKGLRVTSRNLIENSLAIYQMFGHSEESRGFIWLPPYHDMGLIGGILQPLFGRFPVALMSPFDFLQRPEHWLQGINDFRATTSGGPAFAYRLCAERLAPNEQWDLSCWDVAFCGAEPIRAHDLQQFAQRFASVGFSASSFLPCYGLAEATLIVTGGGKKEGAQITSIADGEIVSCGKPAVDTQVRIFTSDGLKLSAGETGEIWVAGPGVADGYEALEEQTAATFVELAPGERWLRTGDLGFLDEAGKLHVTGRLKELIIVAGRNVYPHDLEATACATHADIRAAAAFGIDTSDGEKIGMIIETVRRAEMDATSLQTAVKTRIWQEHDAALAECLLVRPGEIPRTTSGKIRRLECRKMLLSQRRIGES
jgi:acyl-CoA synthetase (AMP-forming)/AMP-acid ligase II